MSPVRAETPTLDVLTFNTWGLAWPVAMSPRSSRFPRIQRFLDRTRPDVVGLQEVWRGARQLLSIDGLRFPRGDRDSGLAMLSRFPVRAQRALNFEAGSGLDRFKDKGAMQATVVHPVLGEVHVITTHLQAGRGAGSRLARSVQVDELLAFVDDLQGPTVLVGDFNLYGDLGSDRAADGRLTTAGFLDSADVLGILDATHHGAGARLDRVYARGLVPLQAEVLPGEGLSDHRPVRVLLGQAP
jgi:endonuclease/exonuclease/phosphatase family metal-dependent hydrolase